MTYSEDTSFVRNTKFPCQFGINQSPNSQNTIHQSDPVQSLVESFEEVNIKDIFLEEQEESECDIAIVRNSKSRYEDEIFALQSIINAKNIEAMCYHTLSQSQKHGYIVENEIRGRVFNVSSTPNQTGTHDITKEENKYNNQENISIKTTVSKNIDCGDILRFYKYDFNEINTMIVVSLHQENDFKNISNIHEINYDLELHRHLFGSITYEELEEYCNFIKHIESGPVDDTIKNAYKSKKNELQVKHNMRINISPKVDSHKQRRVQCSIPKFLQICNDHIVYNSMTFTGHTNVVRNVMIQSRFHSTKRTFRNRHSTIPK